MKEHKLWRNRKPWIGASSDHKQCKMKQKEVKHRTACEAGSP